MQIIIPAECEEKFLEVMSLAGWDEFSLELNTNHKQGFQYKKSLIPNSLRWEVFERDNFTCMVCKSRRELHVDHIVPESRGGESCLSNFQTLCKTCNIKKGAKI